MVVVRVAGGELVGEEQAAGVDAVVEIEGVGGDRGGKNSRWRRLPRSEGSPGAVGAESPVPNRGDKENVPIWHVRDLLKSCKKRIVKTTTVGSEAERAKHGVLPFALRAGLRMTMAAGSLDDDFSGAS